MGRNNKVGIDYFSFDCHPDTKLQLLEAEFGVKGLGILIKLFQKIYSEEGYYMDWTQEVELLFSKKINEGRNLVNEVVKACLKRGIFDIAKYEKHSILTSNGIQKRYLEATTKRVNVKLIEEYVVLSDDNKTIYDGRNAIYDGRNGGLCTRKVHKVKESKVKESKVKESKEDLPDDSNKTTESKHRFGSYKNVLLTDDEFIRLKKDFKMIDLNDLIEWFSAYIEEKGYKSKSHNLAIRRWVIEAYQKNSSKKNRSIFERITEL